MSNIRRTNVRLQSAPGPRPVVPLSVPAAEHLPTIGHQHTFTGLVSVWHAVDTFGSIWMPGCFTATLARHAAEQTRPKLLWQHDVTTIIGRWRRLEQTDAGLEVEGELFCALPKGHEAAVLLTEGELDGLSIGFDPVESELVSRERAEAVVGAAISAQPADEMDRFELMHEVDLLEASLVTFQSVPGALVSAPVADGRAKLPATAASANAAPRADPRARRTSPSAVPDDDLIQIARALRRMR